MSVNIRLETFEGPFDLLFHLIEKNEIDIYNIPIAVVTDQYMDYIDQIQSFDMEVASEFLVMAATLIEIKSKMLLPNSKMEQLEDDFNSDDPRYELVQRLIEYRKYKNAAGFLKERESIYGKLFYKKQDDMDDYITPIAFKDQGIRFETDLLVEAVKNILDKLDRVDMNRKDYFTTLKRDQFTVEEKIDRIKAQLSTTKCVPFKTLFTETTVKAEVIVTFLAVLELLKLKVISIQQEKQFSDIVIVPKIAA